MVPAEWPGPEQLKLRIPGTPTPGCAGSGWSEVESGGQVGRSRRIFRATSLATPFSHTCPRASALTALKTVREILKDACPGFPARGTCATNQVGYWQVSSCCQWRYRVS